jgi:hypothetical protein
MMPKVEMAALKAERDEWKTECFAASKDAAELRAAYAELKDERDHFEKLIDDRDAEIHRLTSVMSMTQRKPDERAALIAITAERDELKARYDAWKEMGRIAMNERDRLRVLLQRWVNLTQAPDPNLMFESQRELETY